MHSLLAAINLTALCGSLLMATSLSWCAARPKSC